MATYIRYFPPPGPIGGLTETIGTYNVPIGALCGAVVIHHTASFSAIRTRTKSQSVLNIQHSVAFRAFRNSPRATPLPGNEPVLDDSYPVLRAPGRVLPDNLTPQ